jgi:hypothetical protein
MAGVFAPWLPARRPVDQDAERGRGQFQAKLSASPFCAESVPFLRRERLVRASQPLPLPLSKKAAFNRPVRRAYLTVFPIPTWHSFSSFGSILVSSVLASAADTFVTSYKRRHSPAPASATVGSAGVVFGDRPSPLLELLLEAQVRSALGLHDVEHLRDQLALVQA